MRQTLSAPLPFALWGEVGAGGGAFSSVAAARMREFLSEITNPAGVTVRVGEGFAEVLRFSGSYRGIWRDEGRCIISGFHSPIEKECLLILLRGNQPVIICPARGLASMRVPVDWKQPLSDNRLLVLSAFGAAEKRVTKHLASVRNRTVAALADEVVFAHVAPGGHLDELRRLVAGWGIPLRSLNDVPSSH